MSSPAWHLVLLAGGRGTRFWPASRAARPKQFLRLAGTSSLLRRTSDRFARAGGRAGSFVVAPREYHSLIRDDLPGLPPAGLLAEPSARDTAAAVGLACLEIRRRDPAGIVVVSPTDHTVADEAAFIATLEAALERAARGGLGTLGVAPARAATEFGYLEVRDSVRSREPVPVSRFVEKPDAETAARYVSGGRHLWNAGLFVFRVDSFFDEISRVAPALAAGLEAYDRARLRGDDAAALEAWESIPRLSLDYSVMERAGNVWTVALDAGWDDLGGWAAAGRLLPRDSRGNALEGVEGLFVDSDHCTIFGAGGSTPPGGSPGPFVVLVGVEGLTVIRTGDVVLVCRTERSAGVKQAVEQVQAAGRRDLL